MKKINMVLIAGLLFSMTMLVAAGSIFAVPASEQLYYTKTTGLSAGSHLLRFSLWTVGSGGTEATNMIWWEDKTLNLTSGTVTTYLGSVTAAASRSGLLGDVDFSQQYWVQIDAVSGTAPNYVYTPVGARTKLNMVPYAMHSITSESAASGGSVPSVTAGSGLTSTTTPAGDITLNVGAGAGLTVGADAVAIKAGGVTSTMLAAGAVTDAKITGPISAAKINSTGLDADKLDGKHYSDITADTDAKVSAEASARMAADATFVDKTRPQTVAGIKTFSDQIVSSVVTGTAPLQVASSTMVANLHADLLDGKHASDIIAAALDEKRTAISSLPYTISASGSYYLTGNLSTMGMGITVNADNVTIDLGGFTITGPGSTNSGIWMNGRTNVEIRNGTIKLFYAGITEISTSGARHRVINVKTIGNANGISLSGIDNFIKQCTSANNTVNGITVGANSSISENIVSHNTGYGIYAGDSASITGNSVSYNGSNGITAGIGAAIFLNTISNNSFSGITTSSSATITSNSISYSGRYGIYPGSGSTITGNSVFYSQWSGIQLTGGYCLADRNVAYANNRALGTYPNITPSGSCTGCVYGLNVAP